MIDIKNLELTYFQNDEPVEYELKNPYSKGYKIKIHPILVKDWSIFEGCLDIIMQDQQDYEQPEIVLMSYLEFISDVLIPSDPNNFDKFSIFINMSLKLKDVRLGKIKSKSCLAIMKEEYQEAIITSKEFDEIKKIILFQNIPTYDDRYISPDIKKELAEYEKIKYKNVASPTFEKQKVFVISKTGIMMSVLNNMTYRTFIQVYNSNVANDLYFAQKMIQASEKYKVDEDIMHPLFKKDNDRFESAFMSKGGFQNKMKGVAI